MTNTTGYAEMVHEIHIQHFRTCVQRYRKSNAQHQIRILLAVECYAVTEFRALCLPMNALCRFAGIGCTITEIRDDCRYLAGKCVYM